MIKKNLFAASLLAMLCLGNANAMNDGDTAETPPQPPAKQTNASAMTDGDAAETPPQPPAKQTTADDEILQQAIKNVHVNVLIVGEKGVGKTALAARIYNGLLSDRGYECISRKGLNSQIGKVPLDQKTLNNLVDEMNKEFKKSGEAAVTYAPPRGDKRFEDCKWHFYIKEANVKDRHINELYKKASLVFPVFDMNDKKFTVEKAMKWYDDIRKAAGEENTHYVSSYICFIGSKLDIFAKNFQGELYDQYGGANYPQNEIFIAARKRIEGRGNVVSCLTGELPIQQFLCEWGEAYRKTPDMAGWKEGGAENFQMSDRIGPMAAQQKGTSCVIA